MDTPTYEITITVGGSGQTTESKIGSVLPQGIITRQSGKIIATFVDAAGAAFDLSSLDNLDLFAKPFNSSEVPVNMGTGVISGAGSNIYTVSWVRDLIPAGWSSFAEDRDGTIVLYLELQETGTEDFYQWSTRFNVEDGDYVGDASVLPLVNIIFYYNPIWGYSNTTVDADPGAGLFRLDDTVLANVTEMYIADDNQSTVDLSSMIQDLGVGVTIYLGNPNVKTDAACFEVSGAIVNNTGYSIIPVTFKSSGSSAFTNGTILSFSFMFTTNVSSAANITDNALVRGDGGAKGIQGSGIGVSDTDDFTGVNSVTVNEIAAPSTPSSGDLIFYADSTTSLPMAKNDAGNEMQLGGAVYKELSFRAGAMTPSGSIPATSGTLELDPVTLDCFDFDAATDEAVQVAFMMPDDWDLGTVKFKFIWTGAGGSGVCFWGVRAVATSNDNPLDVAFGTINSVLDSFIVANDNHTTNATGGVTIGGTPLLADLTVIEFFRRASQGADTYSQDAKLLNVTMQYKTLDTPTAAW